MTVSTSPAGYYPDPFGSGQPRWWDGTQWTEHLAQEAAPLPPPLTVWAPPSAAPGAGSVLGSAPRTGVGVGRVLVVGLVVIALLGAVVGWNAWSHPTTSKASVAAPAPTNGTVVTPTQAADVLKAFWPAHEQALVNHDLVGLRRLETGAAAVFEPGAVACGCLQVAAPRPMLDAHYFIPKQDGYPAHFMTEVRSSEEGQSWASLLVFTKKAASAPWLVEEASGYWGLPGQQVQLGTAAATGDGYLVAPSPRQHARAVALAPQVAALWQSAKNTGRVPSTTLFVTTEQAGGRLATIAKHPQDTVQSNGLNGHFRFFVDPADPMFEFADGLGDLVCQVVRETVVYRPPPGQIIVQDAQQQKWGVLLAPGEYRTVTSHDAWQTCFLIKADPAAPVALLNQDLGGGVPTGSR